MLKDEIIKNIEKKKYKWQSMLTFHTLDLGHETRITVSKKITKFNFQCQRTISTQKLKLLGEIS